VTLIAAGFVRQCRKGIRLLYIYLAFYLVLYLVHPCIAYDRYLLPIVPFLLSLLESEINTPISLVRRDLQSDRHLTKRISAGLIASVLFGAIGVVILSNWFAIYESLGSLKKIASKASEGKEAIEWIKIHTDPSDALICNQDTIYFLYTGRKATPSFQLSMLDGIPYQSREPDFNELASVFLNVINESKGQYLILNKNDLIDLSPPYQKSIEEFIEQRPQKFVPVFESTNRNSTIYRVENSTD